MLPWNLLLTYLVCCAHTDSVQVVMSAEKAVMGHSGSIHCSASFQTDEVNSELEIRSSRSVILFAWTEADNRSSPHTEAESNRYTLDVDTSEENTVHLRLNIDDLICEDEDSYICTATVAVLNTTLIVQSSQRIELRVEVPLTAPKPLVFSQESGVVKEHDWIDVQCSAVVGHTKGTRLVWTLDQGGRVQVLPHRDPRIILHEAHSRSRDGDCLRQVTSTLRLVVTRNHHGCQVSCFVWNPEIQPSLPPRCDHQEKDLCAQTSRLQVHYGVTEETMQLYMLPKTEVIDGAVISMVCRAEGYPPVNYTWQRSPPLTSARRVVVSIQDNTSQLLLPSFDSTTDSGIYKCTAFNWVMGVEFHSASQNIFLSSTNMAQKHVVLQKIPSLEELDQIELILLGVAISAIIIFLITLVVAIIICIYRRHRRHQFEHSDTTNNPAVSQTKEDSEESVAQSEGSGESVNPSGSVQELTFSIPTVTNTSATLPTPDS